MLNSVEIDAFQRIPYLKVALAGASVHVFCGPNEAGKSSLGEAIRFALRGLSRRVKKKQAYGELICDGKRSGSVAIDLAGYPVRRNIRDGKVATKAMLDYPELLVDIQLGAEEFAFCDPDELRDMLNRVCEVGGQEELIRARLAARGITEDMMKRTIPLVRASGFSAAAQVAENEQKLARGKWEGITKETYGKVKALSWQPEILNSPAPTVDELNTAMTKVNALKEQRDDLNRRLGAQSELLRIQQESQATSVEDLEAALVDAENDHTANESAKATAQREYQETVSELEEQVRTLETDVQRARQAAATLECPCCGAHLNIKIKEETALLEKAEKTEKPDTDLRSLVTALEQTRKALADVRRDQNDIIANLDQALTGSQLTLTAARAALDSRRAAAAQPVVTAADVEKIAADIATVDQSLAEAQSKLQDIEERRHAYERAEDDKADAADAAQLTSQWATVAELLGNGPDGIPGELVKATTQPINAALAKLALPWTAAPIVMGNDLSVSRANGTPYYMLSASARWKANAMMQLALATVSKLKLVVLDGFDVIQPFDRGPFFDMLTDYAERHPEVTVLTLGTLKQKPVEAIPGVRFYWIENGQLQEAA